MLIDLFDREFVETQEAVGMRVIGQFRLNSDRPPLARNATPRGLVVAAIYHVDPIAGADFPDFFAQTVKPELAKAGGTILADFVTENSANNFPALPVREGENVLVSFALFADEAAYDRHVAALERSRRWQDEISPG